ncbi:hypothetical protein DFH08DRAFT_827593 [Mycena albidolilacea]|uniref:Uncharacterized protein n=1 Tax=Mycena albidolilacea TaxID=1033008 RepID=A0AAD6YYH4_9AGAR|nr:hypothetical protein DFH08DRAFT_827593 [Mycena albidolilacea]
MHHSVQLHPLIPKTVSQMRPKPFQIERTFEDKPPINFHGPLGISEKCCLMAPHWSIHVDLLLSGDDGNGDEGSETCKKKFKGCCKQKAPTMSNLECKPCGGG